MAEIQEFYDPKVVKQQETYIDNIIKATNETIKLSNAADDLAKKTKKQSDSIKDVDEQTKQYNTLLNQRVVIQGKLAVSESELNKEVLKSRQELAEKNKDIKDTIKLEAAEEKSITRLQLANKRLRKERNALSTETENGRKRIAELNQEINENTSVINENSDAQNQATNNVGNYKSALEGLGGPIGGAIDGFKGMVTSAKAFIATPIGAVLAGIVAVFGLFKSAVGRSEKATESFNKVGAFFTGIWNGVLEAITPVAEFIGETLVNLLENPKQAFKDLGDIILENFINRFKAVLLLGDAWSALMEGDFKKAGQIFVDSTVQMATGITDATEKGAKFVETVKEVQKATIAAANAEREYAKAQIEFEKTQLRLQDEAEKLRQIRDDEALDIQERIQANKDLGETLDRQLNLEKTLALESLQRAKDVQTANGETIESIEAVGEAEIKLLEIEERITGQRSEQLVNTNSLLRDQKDLENERVETLAKSVEEQIAIQEKADEEERARLDAKVDEEIERDTRLAVAKAENKAKDEEQSKSNVDNLAKLSNKEGLINKARAVKQALIDGKAAVQSAFSQTPGPLPIKIAAAALAGGIALKNVKDILAVDTSVPAFADGTTSTPGGNWLAGEAGRELKIDRKGNAMLVSTPTLFSNEVGSTVFKNSDTEAILRGRKEVKQLDLEPLINAVNKSSNNIKVISDKFAIVRIEKKRNYLNRKFRNN